MPKQIIYNNNFHQKIIIDKRLEKFRNIVLFPEKLAKANEILNKVGLPKFQQKSKIANLGD